MVILPFNYQAFSLAESSFICVLASSSLRSSSLSLFQKVVSNVECQYCCHVLSLTFALNTVHFLSTYRRIFCSFIRITPTACNPCCNSDFHLFLCDIQSPPQFARRHFHWFVIAIFYLYNTIIRHNSIIRGNIGFHRQFASISLPPIRLPAPEHYPAHLFPSDFVASDSAAFLHHRYIGYQSL